jgi:hypothetical protein
MRFWTDDAVTFVLQQPAEEVGEGVIGHLLQVAKCLVVYLVSSALIRLVVDSVVEARYSERNK